MEHILQFGVSIDDNAIQKIIEQKAAEKIAEEIKQATHGSNYYGKLNDKPKLLEDFFKGSVDSIIKENKDEIIDKAIAELVKNLQKSKKIKEFLEKLETEEG